jgi:hypothetical protein
MRYIKIIATALVLFASQTFVFSQNPTDKKWDIGFHAGTDIHTFKYGSILNPKVVPGGLSYLINEPIGKRKIDNGFHANLYATRYFTKHWSLRAEFGFSQLENAVYINQKYLSLGLFPRYRINRLIDFELGLETKKSFSYPTKGINNSTFWAGSAFHLGKTELNFRYSPAYHAKNFLVDHGTWSHKIQVGMSVTLFSKKN